MQKALKQLRGKGFTHPQIGINLADSYLRGDTDALHPLHGFLAGSPEPAHRVLASRLRRMMRGKDPQFPPLPEGQRHQRDVDTVEYIRFHLAGGQDSNERLMRNRGITEEARGRIPTRYPKRGEDLVETKVPRAYNTPSTYLARIGMGEPGEGEHSRQGKITSGSTTNKPKLHRGYHPLHADRKSIGRGSSSATKTKALRQTVGSLSWDKIRGAGSQMGFPNSQYGEGAQGKEGAYHLFRLTHSRNSNTDRAEGIYQLMYFSQRGEGGKLIGEGRNPLDLKQRAHTHNMTGELPVEQTQERTKALPQPDKVGSLLWETDDNGYYKAAKSKRGVYQVYRGDEGFDLVLYPTVGNPQPKLIGHGRNMWQLQRLAHVHNAMGQIPSEGSPSTYFQAKPSEEGKSLSFTSVRDRLRGGRHYQALTSTGEYNIRRDSSGGYVLQHMSPSGQVNQVGEPHPDARALVRRAREHYSTPPVDPRTPKQIRAGQRGYAFLTPKQRKSKGLSWRMKALEWERGQHEGEYGEGVQSTGEEEYFHERSITPHGQYTLIEHETKPGHYRLEYSPSYGWAGRGRHAIRPERLRRGEEVLRSGRNIQALRDHAEAHHKIESSEVVQRNRRRPAKGDQQPNTAINPAHGVPPLPAHEPGEHGEHSLRGKKAVPDKPQLRSSHIAPGIYPHTPGPQQRRGTPKGEEPPEDLGQCECSDPGCPAHSGSGGCINPAIVALYETEDENHGGNFFCEHCARDLVDSGSHFAAADDEWE